jgi:peroxiredoxin Q/BCP
MNVLLRTIKFSLMSLLFMQPSHADDLQVGTTAPDFRLKDQNLKQRQLADFSGHWLVLYFYPKDDTPGCTTEACNFRDDYFQLKALQADVIGISLDDSASHEEFAKKYSLPFPLLADLEGKTAMAYGALFKLGPLKFAKRHSFIIDPQAVIRKIYREVDADSHSRQIIEDLKKLQKEDSQ